MNLTEPISLLYRSLQGDNGATPYWKSVWGNASYTLKSAFEYL